MKILVRNVRGESFEIEVKPQDTVADVKKTIESKKGADRYPAGRQMLTHKGEILKDGTTMEENGVAENSSIFVLVTEAIPELEELPSISGSVRSGQAASDVSALPRQAAQPALAPSIGQNINLLNLFPEAIPEPEELPSTSGSVHSGQAASDMPTQPQQAAQPALAPSTRPNTNLLNLFPEAIPEPEGLPSTSGSAHSGQAASDMPVQPQQAAQPALAPSAGLNTNPLNLFPERLPSMGLNADQTNLLDFLHNNSQSIVSTALLANPHIMQSIVRVALLATPEILQVIMNAVLANPQTVQVFSIVSAVLLAGPKIVQSIVSAALPADIVLCTVKAALLANPHIVQYTVNAALLANLLTVESTVSATLLANPHIVQSIVRAALLDNPHIVQSIARLIQERGLGFPGLQNEPIESGGSNTTGPLEGSHEQSPTFTREENEAIERLEARGFRRTAVLQAFLACDRNEELTAYYLLDHRNTVD